jgi:GNAT superfamily N-acetyltransferase
MRPDFLSFASESLRSCEAQSLIVSLNAELSALYPEAGATHFRLDEEEVAPGRGVFLIGRRGGVPICCGALRTLDESTAELKRMFVVPAERRRGVGRALLEALTAQARDLGRTRLVLETGVRQREAIALYSSYGFQRVPLYGEYLGSSLSVCMALDMPRK